VQRVGSEDRCGALEMMDEQLPLIEKVFYGLLCERFSKDAINRVVVKSDCDSDGDRVLRVIVVLEANGKETLDAKKMVGLVRHLRSTLEAKNIDDFPMVSFVSKKEAGKLLESV